MPFIDKDGEGVGGACDNVEGLALLQLRLQGLQDRGAHRADVLNVLQAHSV